MSEEKRELVDHALRTLIEGAKDAFFVLDKEGKVQFLNRRAETLTGKPQRNIIGNQFEDVITTAAEGKEFILDAESRKVVKTWMETPQGTIPAEICVNPLIIRGVHTGTLLTVTTEPERFENFRLLETLSSAIQRQSSAQKIYETLGKELAALGIAVVVLSFEKEWFTIGYHTVDRKKMHITEFIMGIPLSEIRLTVQRDALRKMREQKSLFFHDICSLVESAATTVTSSELHKFLSLVGFSRGVAVPITCEDDLTEVLTLFSEKLHPEDAPVASAVGVQVSAALERARHFEQLVTDLKMLEEQISARTRELEKVKSQMESIVQSSVDAIMAADLDGRIIFVNKGVETMLGYRESDILGQSITNFYAGGRKEAKRLKSIIMKEGQIENTELDFLAEGGRIVHALASLSLLKGQKGTSTGIMAVLKDVTEQKRLQQTLESLNKAAFRIQKSKTREEIFLVTAEELKQFDFHVVFILFNTDKTAGKIEYITAGRMLDTLGTEENVSDFELPLNNPLFKKIKKKEAVYIDDVQTAVKQLVPPNMYTTSEKGINLLDIAHKKAIVAPLIIYDEPIGLLGVISDVITAHDTPPIIAFANQVSTALENARLLEEVQNRADELARNLKEQQLLRELNTKLFLAQSQEEVLDAALEGIHKLGRSFANISMINEERTFAKSVRLEMESTLLKMVEKAGKAILPGFTLGEYDVPVWEKGTIYHTFFENQIPLISSNIAVHEYPVMRADLSEIYTGFASKDSAVQRLIEAARRILPYQSVMVFPIVVGGHTLGSLSVTSRGVFTEKDFILMGTVGEMVSSAMERINHSEKLTETLNELRAVQRITALLNMGASLQEILVNIASSIREVYHYRFAFPVLLDSSRKYLSFEYIEVPPSIEKKLYKLTGISLKDFKYPLSEESPILTQVLKEKKCTIVKGFEELAEGMEFDAFRVALKKLAPDLSKALGMNREINIMIAPLHYGEEVIGILFLGHQKVLTEDDFQQLEYFLDQVGVAIAKSEVETRLRHSLKELRELDQMKSEFIDIASHELRTPLTTLKLYLEMMAMEEYGILSEPLRERIRIMEEGVNRLDEIINQTLVASRLLKNKLTLEKELVSLLDISTEVVRQLRPLWNAKNQNIFIESPPDLSEVEGDQKALFTVVNNLVDNAIRYSAEHTEIFIRFIERPKEVECIVADQGCGIPPENIGKIFDEFYIVPSETEYARIDGRTGLGLFIAKGIVERHNGRIWVESVIEEGSAFHFVLPKSIEAPP